MAHSGTAFKICYDRVIPASMLDAVESAARDELKTRYVEAVNKHTQLGEGFAQRAFSIHSTRALSADDPVHVTRMALINRNKWDNGYTLRCRFLDGSATQRRKVEAKAHIWEQFANIHLVFGEDPNAEVRISFHAAPGSWSAVGNDCLNTSYFPKFQPTMNFGWLEDNTDANEYERVVVHEFGHALGCIHEHQSPAEKLHWDKAAVYKAFSGPPNYWSKADIDSNILEKYSAKGITLSRFDMNSIMLYQFDASLFTDHKGTPENTHLSATDKQMIGEMYPGRHAAAA